MQRDLLSTPKLIFYIILFSLMCVFTEYAFSDTPPIIYQFNSPLVKTSNRIVSIPAATSSVDGYLLHTDFATFNGKANADLSNLSGSILIDQAYVSNYWGVALPTIWLNTSGSDPLQITTKDQASGSSPGILITTGQVGSGSSQVSDIEIRGGDNNGTGQSGRIAATSGYSVGGSAGGIYLDGGSSGAAFGGGFHAFGGSGAAGDGSQDGDIELTGRHISLTTTTSTGKVIVTAASLDMSSKKIINLLDPGSNQDAATKYYVDTGLATKQATGNYLTALTSDVSASGPGSAAATVNSIGGSSSTNVHNAELLANAATNLNTASTIVKRDSSGNFTAGTITAALTGNATTATSATTATNATNTAITDDTTTNATMYPTWVTTASSNQAQKVSSTKLTFNPSTAALTTTTFVGALTGTASGNTTYTANQYGVVLSGSGNTMSVLAPDSSTTKFLTSGGTGANPTWSAMSAGLTSGQSIAHPNIMSGTTTSFSNFTIMSRIPGESFIYFPTSFRVGLAFGASVGPVIDNIYILTTLAHSLAVTASTRVKIAGSFTPTLAANPGYSVFTDAISLTPSASNDYWVAIHFASNANNGGANLAILTSTATGNVSNIPGGYISGDQTGVSTIPSLTQTGIGILINSVVY